jgi:hypothetical protein
MSANPSTFSRTNTPFSPEQRASFLAWRFGSTLDWCSAILREINYPVTELRWFVDAVQGLCKGKEMRIAHSTLAKRAQRFKNKSQASDLARRAIEANNEWARDHRCMIFDIERPKPGEMEGKDKRARTKYTDYLTPAAVWAQDTAHKVKKADELRWKKDRKYCLEKREEILAEALKMLPMFEKVEDMPSTTPPPSEPLSLSAYVEQREKILLAENRRILDRVTEGDLYDAEEIDARLAALEVFYAKAAGELKKSFESTRDVLLGLRKTRLTRAMDFTDTAEVMAEFDEKLAQKGKTGDTLVDEPNTEKKGKTHDTLVDPLAARAPDAPGTSERYKRDGYINTKGVAGDTLSVTLGEAVDDELEEFVFGDTEAAPDAENLLTMEEAAVLLAEDFLLVPNYAPTPDGGCTCHKGKNCTSAGKHPIFDGWGDPKSENCATNDVRKIRAWWRKYPNANIGIATGALGGVVVLDADFPKGGDVGLTALLERLGLEEMPPTMATNTGAGVHFYYKYGADDIRNSASKIAKGVDVRGAGGQVVSAPSLHRSGRRYLPANNLKPAPLPKRLREEMLNASKKEAKPINPNLKTSIPRAGTYFSSSARMFPDGERNEGIRDVSYGRWVNGWAETESDLVSQLLEVNATRCIPPLENEVVIELAQRTARTVARGERQHGGVA